MLTLLVLGPHSPVILDRFRQRIPLKSLALLQDSFWTAYMISSVEPKFDQRRRYIQLTGQGPVGTGSVERAHSLCPP